MTMHDRGMSEEPIPPIVVAAVLSALVLAYIALCLVVLYRPAWLPHRSIFATSLVGPPLWMALGTAAHSMFWGSTLAIVAVALIGATVRPLVLVSAGLCLLIWLGAGLLAVGMSV